MLPEQTGWSLHNSHTSENVLYCWHLHEATCNEALQHSLHNTADSWEFGTEKYSFYYTRRSVHLRVDNNSNHLSSSANNTRIILKNANALLQAIHLTICIYTIQVTLV